MTIVRRSIDLSTWGDLRDAAPVTAAGSVVIQDRRTSGANAPDDLEVFRIHALDGGEEQLTANDVDDYLLDARGEAILLARGWPGAISIVYRDDSKELTLREGGARVGFTFDQSGAPIRKVEKDRAAWNDGDAIQFFDGDRVRVVSTTLRGNGAPYLRGNIVVWSAFDGRDDEIIVASPDGTHPLTDNDARDIAPVLAGSTVYWLSGGAVVAQSYNGGEVRRVHDGPCGPPAPDGDAVVFTCGGAEDSASLAIGGRQLFRFDGSSLSEVPTGGGRAFAPRASEGRVTWIEYDAGRDLCNYAGDAQGSIMLFVSGVTKEPLAIARVSGPCLCCDAYWPPAQLGFENDVIAWNYDIREGTPEGMPGPRARASAVGYALVGQEQDCE